MISSRGSNQLRAVMSDARLSEAREYAVQQNINILRNRVNQLGVAEPVVQRQGADRIVVELRYSGHCACERDSGCDGNAGIPSGKHQR